MNWISAYLEYAENHEREIRIEKFIRAMYPTGWHHYGTQTCRIWAMQGLKILGLI